MQKKKRGHLKVQKREEKKMRTFPAKAHKSKTKGDISGPRGAEKISNSGAEKNCRETEEDPPIQKIVAFLCYHFQMDYRKI